MQIFGFIFSILSMLLVGCASTSHTPQHTPIVKHKFDYRPIANDKLPLADIEKQMQAALLFSQQEGDDSLRLLTDDLFLKGNDAAFQGEGELALLYFKYAHLAMPKELYLQQKYAFQLVKVGKLKKAQVELEQLVKLNPQEQKLKMVLAGVYTAQNKLKSAAQIYKKLLSRSDHQAGICLNLNNIYVMQKKYKSSLQLLERCRKLAKSSEEKMDYIFYKAKTYLQQGKRRQAVRVLKVIMRKDPSYQQAWLTRGLMLEEKKKFSQAIRIYKKALKYGEDNYVILSRLTNLMIVKGQIKQSLEYLSRLVDIDPDNLGSLIKLGIAQSDARQLAAAKQTFLTILKKVPNSDKVLYYLGVLSIEMNNLEESLDYFGRITADSSFFLDSNLQMANVLLSLSGSKKMKKISLSDIEKHLLRLLSVAQDNEDYQFQIGLKLVGFYENSGQIRLALKQLLTMQNSKHFNNDHIYYMASLYEKLNQKDKARAAVAEIIKKDPNNAQAYNFYGYSLLEEGKEMAKAYQYIRKAVELAPKDAYIRDSLGWYYFKMNNFVQAQKHLELAYKQFAQEPTIVEHLAKVYAKLNQVEKAKRFYTKAIKLSTTKQQREKLKQEMQDFANAQQTNRLPASNN